MKPFVIKEQCKRCKCGHLECNHNYDFTEECSECSGGQCPRFDGTIETKRLKGNETTFNQF